MRTHTPYRAVLPIRGRMLMRHQLVNPTAKVSHLGQQSRTIAREFLGDGEPGRGFGEKLREYLGVRFRAEKYHLPNFLPENEAIA